MRYKDKKGRKQKEYYVKWAEYGDAHNTWEPATSFAAGVIEAWENENKGLSEAGPDEGLGTAAGLSTASASDITVGAAVPRSDAVVPKSDVGVEFGTPKEPSGRAHSLVDVGSSGASTSRGADPIAEGRGREESDGADRGTGRAMQRHDRLWTAQEDAVVRSHLMAAAKVHHPNDCSNDRSVSELGAGTLLNKTPDLLPGRSNLEIEGRCRALVHGITEHAAAVRIPRVARPLPASAFRGAAAPRRTPRADARGIVVIQKSCRQIPLGVLCFGLDEGAADFEEVAEGLRTKVHEVNSYVDVISKMLRMLMRDHLAEASELYAQLGGPCGDLELVRFLLKPQIKKHGEELIGSLFPGVLDVPGSTVV